MVSSSHLGLEVGSKPTCNGSYELSELRSRDRGFLTYFVPFEPSDFGLVHPSELSFPFLIFLVLVLFLFLLGVFYAITAGG